MLAQVSLTSSFEHPFEPLSYSDTLSDSPLIPLLLQAQLALGLATKNINRHSPRFSLNRLVPDDPALAALSTRWSRSIFSHPKADRLILRSGSSLAPGRTKKTFLLAFGVSQGAAIYHVSFRQLGNPLRTFHHPLGLAPVGPY